MHLRQLQLVHFRNYERQELRLAPGPVLFLGENAQGKTNLLEAVFLLAAGRSERASSDADYIGWSARGEPQPFARIAATAVRAAGDVTVELTVAGREGPRGALAASKRYKLNGVPKRASDVVGAITAVLFTTDDMELVKGAPAGRRRYLDVMLSQADHRYLRALQRYTKVVTQRNALLRRIQDGAARPDELAYWDEQLAGDGALLLVSRAQAVARLAGHAAEAHGRLSDERERLGLAYEPRFVEGWPPARIAAAEPADVASALLARLEATHERDAAAGVTLVGPHRDDLALTLGGEPAGAFASRGQQRTAALALRLAEARLLSERTGDRPLLLLDDVLSELDAARRASVLGVIDADQVLITGTDPDRFDAAWPAGAQVYRVRAGHAERV
ncbi:MAG: DNA replication/repair protein RecF [Chloroflexota bacterium]|nr:DNA replication/repair protein RecF [Chloroflexota bacterium]